MGKATSTSDITSQAPRFNSMLFAALDAARDKLKQAKNPKNWKLRMSLNAQAAGLAG